MPLCYAWRGSFGFPFGSVERLPYRQHAGLSVRLDDAVAPTPRMSHVLDQQPIAYAKIFSASLPITLWWCLGPRPSQRAGEA